MSEDFERSVVYVDTGYETGWIKRKNSTAIADFLTARKFVSKDAGQLSTWMDECLQKELCHECTVVFSQDMIPNTICDKPNANALLRQYLDEGGKVVWIGDAPCWFQAKKDKTKEWNVGGAASVIGVITLFAVPRTPCSLTVFGKRTGLSQSWSGTKPVASDPQLKPLAISDDLVSFNLVRFEPPRSKKQKAIDFLKRARPKKIEVQVSPASFGFEWEEKEGTTPAKELPSTDFNQSHVSAWLKCFNKAHRNRGFLRIWDYAPSFITKGMLEDLYSVSLEPGSEKIIPVPS